MRSAFFQTFKQFLLNKGTDVMHRVNFGYRDMLQPTLSPLNLPSISPMTKCAFS